MLRTSLLRFPYKGSHLPLLTVLSIICTLSSMYVISVWEPAGSGWSLPFILFAHVPIIHPQLQHFIETDSIQSFIYSQFKMSYSCFVVELAWLLSRSARLQESFKVCMKCKYMKCILCSRPCLFIDSSCLQSHPDSVFSVDLLLVPSHRSAVFPDSPRPSCPLRHGGRLLQCSQMSTGWWDAGVEHVGGWMEAHVRCLPSGPVQH